LVIALPLAQRGGRRKTRMRRPAVVVARAAREVRGLWPDRNPLRRTADRIEAAIVSGLAVAFLAGVPVAAVGAEHAAFSAATRTAYAQRSWHQTPAVLLASAPSSSDSKYGTPVRARWAAPHGARRTGTVTVVWGAKAGSTVMVWVDASGRLTGPAAAAFPGPRPGCARGRARPGCAGPAAAVRGRAGPRCAGPAADGRVGHRLADNRTPVDQAALSLPTAGTPGDLAWRSGSPWRAWQPRSP
jgi:hypothetical protein